MTSIKPIETAYKGYRFRSRLEARWAVFFESLGIRWSYETQGFQLPDGSAYLPDFYLPDQDTYVEIKPEIDYKRRNVYMAGKFSGKPHCNGRGNWRELIIPEFSSYSWESPFYYNRIRGYHHYVGPYYAGRLSSHSSHIAKCTHGCDVNYYSDYKSSDGSTVYYPCDIESSYDKKFIQDNCLEAIYLCNTFFVWIDSLDCFGTLAEIGYAKALEKDIFIGISEDLEIPITPIGNNKKPHNYDDQSDLWFIEGMAKSVIRAKSPRQAYDAVLVNLPTPFKKIVQIPNGLLIAGNPYPGEYVAYSSDLENSGPLYFSSRWNSQDYSLGPDSRVGTEYDKKVIQALNKARAARFEFGEAA